MSRFWAVAFPRFYRLIRFFERPIRVLTRRYGLGDTVEVTIVGPRTGRARSVLLGLLRVRGDWYVGHPNGACGWTRALDSAGEASLEAAGGVADEGLVVEEEAVAGELIAGVLEAAPESGELLFGQRGGRRGVLR